MLVRRHVLLLMCLTPNYETPRTQTHRQHRVVQSGRPVSGHDLLHLAGGAVAARRGSNNAADSGAHQTVW